MVKMTREDFIQKAKEIHGDKYDYSKVEYINNITKVCIICPEHGEFWQMPATHTYKKSKCKKCSNVYSNSTDEFIQKAKEIHGNKYDYSKVQYKNFNSKIVVVCPIHGEIMIPAGRFLKSKVGCPKCGYDTRFGRNAKTIESFIKDARDIHGDKYDYSKVIYKNSGVKVEIICSLHGIFLQSPRNHLSGNGCSKCRNSKGEIKIKDWLSKNNIEHECQKTFNDCINNSTHRRLPFDFYLPKYNLIIEFDGKQHFKEGIGGHVNKHQITQKDYDYHFAHDTVKNKYCVSRKINLLRIPYYKLRKVEQILKENIYDKNI